MQFLLVDPWFYAAAVPAVLLVGLSKGGLGGGVGFVGVPLMALVMPPVQAAAILLPILCLMDVAALWTWRGVYDRRTLIDTLPGSIAGIGLGWLFAAMVTEEMVRLIIGTIALAFVLRWLYLRLRHGAEHTAKPNRAAAAVWAPSPVLRPSWPISAARRSRSIRCRFVSIRRYCRARRRSSSPSPMH